MWGADVIRSSLDLNAPRAQYTARGSYYKHEPNDLTEGAQPFNYEYIDPLSKTFRRLYGNYQSFSAGELAIRTRDRLEWRVNAFVVTSDGAMYVITDIQQDFSSAPKQAFRIAGMPVGVEWVLRLMPYQNPWGIK